MFIPGVTAGGHKYPPVVSTNTIVPVPTEYTQLMFSGQIVRAGNSDNTVVFHYGTLSDLSTYNTTSPAATVANGTYSLNVFFTQTGLNPNNAGTTYYYRIVSTNLVGTVFGDIKSATVPVRPPTVTTTSGSDATVVPGATTTTQSNANATSATLNGTATNATSCYFQYSTNAGMTGATNTGNTANQTSPSIGISSLSPGTTYYYRLVSSNALTRATFNGTVNPQNRDTNTIFRYATTSAGVAGSSLFVSGPNPVTNTTTQSVSVTPSLAAGTYYYQLEATNAGGTSVSTTIESVTIGPRTTTSSILSFTTYSYRSQAFTTSGTWARPSAPTGYAPITSVTVTAVGGGGGGGRGTGGFASEGGAAGGGGGGQVVTAASAVSGNLAVTVGAGGTKASAANALFSGLAGDPSSAGSVSAAGGVGGTGGGALGNGGASGSGFAGGSLAFSVGNYSTGGGGGGSTGSGGNATSRSSGAGGTGTSGRGGGGGGAGWWYDLPPDAYIGTYRYVVGAGSSGGTNGAEFSASDAANNSGGGGGGSAKASSGQGGSGYVFIEWYGP